MAGALPSSTAWDRLVTMTLSAASKILGVHPGTVRKWIRQGAPTLELGSVGRGHSSQVDPEAIRRWLVQRDVPGVVEQTQAAQLNALADSLWRVLRNDQAARVVGITERQAAGLLLLTYERLAKDLTREPVDLADLPAQMKLLGSISVQ